MKKEPLLIAVSCCALIVLGAAGACKLHQTTSHLTASYENAQSEVTTLIDTLSDISDSDATIFFGGGANDELLLEPDALPGEAMSETAPTEYPDGLFPDETAEPDSEHCPLPDGIEAFPEAITESLSETMTASDGKYTPPVPAADHRVIFVGDSRTVGMGRAETKLHNDACIYIGESGEGFHWFLDYGMDQLQEALKAYPDLPVVYNLGVNDCDSISSYIEVYQVLENEHPDTDFWYLSVNPVTEESPHVPNSDVLAFNEKLRAAFPEQYIDTCSWMMRDGFDDVDSIHYTEEQYCLIHDFAVEVIAQAAKNMHV